MEHQDDTNLACSSKKVSGFTKTRLELTQPTIKHMFKKQKTYECKY